MPSRSERNVLQMTRTRTSLSENSTYYRAASSVFMGRHLRSGVIGTAVVNTRRLSTTFRLSSDGLRLPQWGTAESHCCRGGRRCTRSREPREHDVCMQTSVRTAGVMRTPRRLPRVALAHHHLQVPHDIGHEGEGEARGRPYSVESTHVQLW